MADKLMSFNDDMVQAIMAGLKTQTRRELKLREFHRSTTPGYDWQFRCRRGLWQDVRNADFFASKYLQLHVGDRIGVRESAKVIEWRYGSDGHGELRLQYRSDGAETGWMKHPERLCVPVTGHYLPNGVFREAVRTWCEVAGVRIERLNEISEYDAILEGCRGGSRSEGLSTARNQFEKLWQSIYGPGSFDGRWVVAITFRRV